MASVNMLDAKSSLAKLVDSLERGLEKEIIIARDGKPVARLTPIQGRKPGQRIGVAKGKFVVPDTLDADNERIADMLSSADE